MVGEGEERWFLGDLAFHQHVTGEYPAGPHRGLSSLSLPSILTGLHLLYLKTEAEGRERRVPRRKGHRWVFRCLSRFPMTSAEAGGESGATQVRGRQTFLESQGGA